MLFLLLHNDADSVFIPMIVIVVMVAVAVIVPVPVSIAMTMTFLLLLLVVMPMAVTVVLLFFVVMSMSILDCFIIGFRIAKQVEHLFLIGHTGGFLIVFELELGLHLPQIFPGLFNYFLDASVHQTEPEAFVAELAELHHIEAFDLEVLLLCLL